MGDDVLDSRIRWFAAAAVAIVIVGLLLALFQFPAGAPLAVTAKPATRVVIADARPENSVVNEAAMMHDLAPLFLPTERNATLASVPRPQLGRGLLDVEAPKFTFTDAELRIGHELPPATTLNGKRLSDATALDFLGNRDAPNLSGFGRSPVELAPAEPRGGFVEVIAMDSGERVLAEVLPLAARAPSEKLWQPPHFIAVIGPGGLLSPIRVIEGSRAEEVDQHYRNYLARIFRIGERLPPGFYRVIVSP